ncbi:hypothetical protein [Singulisphaera acidiphila]|uniref:Uncharacterized protein n=1 Tax=Singulisphaera acidiphila (strain ATCC BAA-1392 / DSM 18658 / VKM B-2454 / MOB10) TaxID=886293 RepID=L0D7S2_SINAD|nr:hypothetical protein [Singulisphaera acidiphila]AGA25449.1 hypothetical protein Sinac_1050 [Singulisphaera acidiphila DSM 18658]
MSLEFPELPDLPEIPELPEDFPITEQTVRSLWNVVRGLHALLRAEIHSSRAMAKIVLEDRENQEMLLGIVRGHHTVLSSAVNILSELKGENSPPLNLPPMPPHWSSSENC